MGTLTELLQLIFNQDAKIQQLQRELAEARQQIAELQKPAE